MVDPGAPLRADLMPLHLVRPVDVVDLDGDACDCESDSDVIEHDRRSREALDGLVADVRDAVGRLDELGPAGREVGRWLHARAGHALVRSRHGSR